MGFHNSSGQFRVYLSGREVYLGTEPVEAQARYRRAVAEWMSRSCQAPAPSPEDIRVLELASRYTVYAREYYAACPKNVERLKIWLQPLLDLCGTLPAIAFTPQLLKAVRTTMVEGRPADPATGKGGRHGWTRKYTNQAIQAIRSMYKWATSEGLLPVAVWQALTTVEGLRKGFSTAKESGTREAITQEELDAVRKYLPSPVMSALEVMYLCGARPSEILNLRPRDIDRNGDVWRVVLNEHKTAHLGKDRVLHFGPKAQTVLKPFLLRADDAYLFSPAESTKETVDRRHEARVTPDKYGNNIGTNRVKRPKVVPGDHYEHAAFRRCLARAVSYVNRDRKEKNVERKAEGVTEIPLLRQFCPYEARHSAAVRIREAASLDAVQAVLGHSKIDMSAHYAKLNGDLAAAIMAKIG
jgi:integrase